MNDAQIVDLFFSRDENAVCEVQKNYNSYLLAISRNVLDSETEAEECVNEALSAVWNSIPPKKPENLKAYVGKIVREISVSRWRKNHAEKRVPSQYSLSLDELEDVICGSDFTKSVEKKELSEYISAFLRDLPQTERNIFIRRYWYNDGIKEISKRFGFGESKVKMTLKRTREKLSSALKKGGFI